MDYEQPVRWWHQALLLTPLIPAAFLPGIGVLVSLAIVIVVLVALRSARQPTFALTYRTILVSIALGLGAALAIGLFMGLLIDPLLEQAFGPIDLGNFAGVEGNLTNYLALLALGLLFGGIVEELIFRGFVIGWGSQLVGARAAIPLAILSAGVFGIAHLYQGWAGVLSTGLFGLAFGLLYVFAGRKLLPSVVAHMATNFYGVTLIYLGA